MSLPFLTIVGLDIRTETFLHGASGVSQGCVLLLLAQEHQKHHVEMFQLLYPTRHCCIFADDDGSAVGRAGCGQCGVDDGDAVGGQEMSQETWFLFDIRVGFLYDYLRGYASSR